MLKIIWIGAVWTVGIAGFIMVFINISPLVKGTVLALSFLFFNAGIVHLALIDENFDCVPWISASCLLIFGLLLYAFGMPEKYYRTKFDLLGASHQIWHVLVLIVCYIV